MCLSEADEEPGNDVLDLEIDTFKVEVDIFDENKRASARPKIVGGTPASPRQYQFLVSLQGTDGGHFCGATLISPWWVMTAAHCTEGESASQLSVVIGAHSLGGVSGDSCAQRLFVEEIINHPRYSSSTLEHDISLLKVLAVHAIARSAAPTHPHCSLATRCLAAAH